MEKGGKKGVVLTMGIILIGLMGGMSLDERICFHLVVGPFFF